MQPVSSLTGDQIEVADAALYRGKVGLVCFYISEAHMFGALIAAFLIYLGPSQASDTPPREVLHLPLAIGMSICLFSSSGTIYLAMRQLRRGSVAGFAFWWFLTIVLGSLFLIGTGFEWNDLINHESVTLGRNLFGTTYYPLIGLHAGHVTIGVILMLSTLVLTIAGRISTSNMTGPELISWYWHFVDAVWVVLFSVVYLATR